MPPKIRELIRELENAGFRNRGGKGSHRNYQHRTGARITIGGKLGDNAKPYVDKEVRRLIAQVSDEKK
jgi:predicted RNA binding protein YcfA (HicA-like mRNA interferase family)